MDLNAEEDTIPMILAPYQFMGHGESVHVERGRDWENKKECLIFSGLSETGKAIWGKKSID